MGNETTSQAKQPKLWHALVSFGALIAVMSVGIKLFPGRRGVFIGDDRDRDGPRREGGQEAQRANHRAE